MIKKTAVFLFIVFIGILATSAFESTVGGSEEFAGYQNQEKRSENIFASQNYLLPLEKVLLPVKKTDAAEISLTAKAVLAVDNSSGKVIYEKNADKKLPVASLTKLSTALTILELSDKNIYADKDFQRKNIYNLDKPVVISKSAIAQEGNSGSLIEEESIRASDLLAAMLIASSNDAAWALAEDVARSMKDGGEIKDFIQLMNDLSAEEKLSETHFSNPTGIDDAENYSSAGDVLRVAQRFMRYYPEAFALTKIKSMEIKSADGKQIHRLENTDKLLGRMEGIIGGKTGYTDEAGESLALIVKNNSSGIIISAVVIGSKDRFGEMEKLVNWVWKSYEWK